MPLEGRRGHVRGSSSDELIRRALKSQSLKDYYEGEKAMNKIKFYTIGCLLVITLSVASVSEQNNASSTANSEVSALQGSGKPTQPVIHDSSLTGEGTTASPLGVSVPLSLI